MLLTSITRKRYSKLGYSNIGYTMQRSIALGGFRCEQFTRLDTSSCSASSEERGWTQG